MSKYVGFIVLVVIMLSLIIGCGERKTKEQLFAEAENLENGEKYVEAIKVYEKFIKQDKKVEKSDQAQYKIALIYSNNLNDFEKSIDAHLKLIEQYPQSNFAVQSLFMIGFICANNINDLDKAEKYYKEFLEKYPDHELANSVKWELDHLGQDINEIEFLNQPAEGVDTTQPTQ